MIYIIMTHKKHQCQFLHAQMFLMFFRSNSEGKVDFTLPMYNLMILSTSPFIIYHLCGVSSSYCCFFLNLKCDDNSYPPYFPWYISQNKWNMNVLFFVCIYFRMHAWKKIIYVRATLDGDKILLPIWYEALYHRKNKLIPLVCFY